MTKLTIKPRPGSFGGTKDVFHEGQLVASYEFSRQRQDRGGRVTITHRGRVTKADGTVIDISNYCWDADVRRHMAFIIGLEG